MNERRIFKWASNSMFSIYHEYFIENIVSLEELRIAEDQYISILQHLVKCRHAKGIYFIADLIRMNILIPYHLGPVF